jgi:serine phosphatase RsbU (regulator of sigma subunit)
MGIVRREDSPKEEYPDVARHLPITFLMFLCLGCWSLANAQPVPGQQTTVPAAALGTPEITLGKSAVPLTGPWKFHVGDSPQDSSTRTPLWAEPGFDDSGWENVDLSPSAGGKNPFNGDPFNGDLGYLPGWAARGHARYSGYAWYRIRVKVDAAPGTRLALASPPDVDDAFQVFDNGGLVGSFGDFSRRTPVAYYTQPTMFRLPLSSGSPASSELVLAFRVWMGPNALSQQPDAGGIHNAPLLGDAGAVTASYQIHRHRLIRAYTPLALEASIYLLLAAMSFSMLLFDRTDRAFFWTGSVLLLAATDYALSAISSWTTYLGFLLPIILRDNYLTPLVCAGWVMVWWVWFRLHRPAWVPRAVSLLTVLLIISNTIGGELLFSFIPHPVALAFLVVSLVIRVLFFVILVWVVTLGMRRRRLEGWLVMPAVVLRGLGQFQREHSIFHLRVGGFPLGLDISIAQIANLLLAALLGVLLLRRLLNSLRQQKLMSQDINQRLLKSGQEQYLMAMDMRQAQEVQQVILPEARTVLPGLVIESEYRPARAVGGDFFQIIPEPADGSLLIVAGDVAGKGLKAGMMVAFLVGAIRSTVDWSPDPAVVLRALNQRLIGRGDGQATCLALRIGADGDVVLANAGHIPPYLNGEPLEVEGALPLGIKLDVDVSVMRFKLGDGDRLVLMSDGIMEAMDAAGNLFGFERTHELVRKSKTAAEVAAAAQKFGQEDDISVISVTRTVAIRHAVA